MRVAAPILAAACIAALAGCGSSASGPVKPLADIPTSSASSTPSTSVTPTTSTTPTTTAAVAAGAGLGYGSGVDEAVARRAVRAAVPSTTRRTTTSQRAATEQKAAASSFGSCAQAKAAGAAPLHAGEPGYSRKLDRDGDGVACES